MNTTQVLVELARTARSCAQTAAHPERRAAHQGQGRGLILPANAPPAMIDPGQIAAIVARAVAETVPAVLASLRGGAAPSVTPALGKPAKGQGKGRLWDRHPILSIEDRIAAARKVDALLIMLRLTPAEFARKASRRRTGCCRREPALRATCGRG